MRRITHAVDREKTRDLLESVPRACMAFVEAGVIEVVPVEFRYRDECYWIGIPGGERGAVPGPEDPVRLMIDEGMYYFDMRGIWIRGRISFSEDCPEGDSPDLRWFQLAPEKFLAWDFGAMREVRGQ